MLTLDRILDTAIAIGLDRFRQVEVARALGVTDMALYRHVRNREELYSRAAARAHALTPFDPSAITDWTVFLERAGMHDYRVAHRHPGIERYILDGPYHPETLAIFDANVAALSAIAPSFGPHESYLLLSRVSSLSYAAAGNALARRYQEDPDRPGELFVWTLRALIEGMGALLAAGELPKDRRALSLGPADRVEPDGRGDRSPTACGRGPQERQ